MTQTKNFNLDENVYIYHHAFSYPIRDEQLEKALENILGGEDTILLTLYCPYTGGINLSAAQQEFLNKIDSA